MQIVCPISMASDNVKMCHPNCKFLIGSECLLVKALSSLNK